MSSKQDRQGVRTAADIERKYNLKWEQSFAELMGVSKDTRQNVDRVESELRSDMEVQVTSITRDTERIIMAALESYVETADYDKFRETVESELSVMADKISMNFEATTEQVTDLGGDLQTVIENLQKHFDFSVDGLTIRGGAGSMELVLDNDIIKFMQNGQQFGWWDGVNFHTGSVVVELNERAQFGNFAFVPRSNGSLDFLKVGG